MPHPSFFEGWDSTVVSRLGFSDDFHVPAVRGELPEAARERMRVQGSFGAKNAPQDDRVFWGRIPPAAEAALIVWRGCGTSELVPFPVSLPRWTGRGEDSLRRLGRG